MMPRMAAAIKRWRWIFAVWADFSPLWMALGVTTVTLGAMSGKKLFALGQGSGVILSLLHQPGAATGYLGLLLTRGNAQY
jgi:hypothetical protein